MSEHRAYHQRKSDSNSQNKLFTELKILVKNEVLITERFFLKMEFHGADYRLLSRRDCMLMMAGSSEEDTQQPA